MSPVGATPPSRQEISRKLSLHSAAKKPPAPLGNESDSDISEIATPAATVQPQPPLSAIRERNSVSSSDSSEGDHDDAEGWRASPTGTFAKAGEEVIKTGYLWKKGERRKTWKKRWFVLRPTQLAYYKSAKEYQLLKLLDLHSIHSCQTVTLKRHDNTFGLISPTRTLYLQAQKPAEVTEWVNAIEAARQTLVQPDSPTKPHRPTESIPIPKSSPIAERGPITPSPPSFSLSHAPGLSSASESDDGGYAAHSPVTPSKAPASVKTSIGGVKDPSKTVLSGYLMKCDSKRKHWRKRYFVLTGEKLLYYSSHMDAKPHRSIPLTDVLDALEYDLPSHSHKPHAHSISNPPASPTQPIAPQHGSGTSMAESGGAADEEKHTFKIVCTKRALLVCAHNEEDEIRWLGAVRALIARRNPNTFSQQQQGSSTQQVEELESETGSSIGGSSGIKGRRGSASRASSGLPVTRETEEL